MLRIREQHSKEKASLATATNRRPIGEENSQYRSDISSIGNLSSAADDASAYSAVHASTYEANSKLLEQIESLRREYKKSQESFADERRSLQIDYSNKMLTLERRLKAEIVELKASNSLIEDRLGQSAEELVAKQAEIERLVTENIGLEASKQQALDGQNKLRADIKNMQQSVQASYRLEASQGLTTGVVDPATAIRLNDAKNEAKNRQLVNKVEFLKSQLEAEKKAADDARAAMEQSREKLEEIREEFKYRMVEAEASKKNAVAEAEQQLESYYEERMQELTTLQARFMSMQSQLQDAQQESILAKQREESIKTVNNKALAHQAALRTEMDQLRLQLEDVKNERDRELANQSNKQSADATIRRLDNERQYLKSQLASEITHKNEVQNALTRSQLQLSDVQRQWKDDVDTLKDTLAAEERLRQEMEQKLDTMEKQSSTESMRLQSQNKELKEAFVKIRDQLRMEQLACENARTNGRRLQENLDDASKEIRRLQETEQQNELLHQEQLAAMTATLKQQEEDGLREVMKLKDELTKEYLANSQAQRQVMECADRFANEKKFIDRNNRTNIMGEKLNKYRLSRLAVAFRTWSTTNTFMGVAIQFREQVEELLQRNTEELNLDKAKAVDELRRVLGRETDQKLAAMQGECERAMADGLANAELNKQMELDNANAEYMRRLEDADNSFHSQLDGARRIAALELQQAVDKKNIQIQQLLEDHREANELALQEAAERIAQAQMEKEKEMNELWEAKIAQLESSWKVLRDKILEEAERNHEEKLERQKKQFLVEQRQLKELADEELRKSLAKAKQQYERDLEAREVAKNAEMTAMRTSMLEEEKNRLRSYRAEMHEATEQRIRELRGLWQNELDAMNEQKRKEFEDLLEVKMEEYAKSTEADRRKAIKLEASKWRQALKDAEQNHELELVRMKAETSNEKEKERLQELEIANNKFAWQRQQDLNQHEANMEEQRQQFRKDLEKLEAHHEEQLGERQLQTEARMKEQLDTFWTAKMKQEIADVESNWKKKLERERDRLESFKQDVEVHKQQMAEERTYLQSRINKSEELIRQIDELGRAEVVRAMKEFEEQKQAMETQFLEEKKAMEKRFQQSQADLTNQINEEHAQETGRLLEEERKIMNEELERQMSQVQEESERLISGLENAIAELRKEKGALSLQLETLSGKLEDTEDALFDSQQELKNAMKSQSLTSWKASAKMMIMKERFQKGMTDFDREAQKRYESVRREMQSSINDCTLTIMKLAVLMHNVERNRVTTQTTIANYKTAELAAKRNKIQLLEKDLERVTMEKDSLDEQKDLVEGEIDQLEQLVREVEDQLREHNRTSSMTNGRINVAHARKKRRLDSELERMLDSIEQKRVNILQLEERISDKAKERDDKEMEMKELEKSLVQILLEQQKQIYTQVDAVKLIEDQCKLLINVERLPWPPPENPTLEDVHQIVALREREQDGTQSRTIEEEQQTAFNTNANTNDGIAVAGDSASMAGTNVIDKMKFPNQKASSRSKEKEPAQQKNSKKK